MTPTNYEKLALSTLRLVLLVPVTLLEAYTLSMLWAWFIVTAFGASPLGMGAAWGACLFADYVLHKHPNVDNYTAEELWARNKSMAAESLVVPVIFLAIGWVAHRWIWT